MLNGGVRPSTIEGVKRLANQLKKSQGIKHSRALDLAAQAADCQNYRHAQHELPARSTQPAGHAIFVTVYWQDRENWDVGRETLKLDFDRPMLEMFSTADLRHAPGFKGMRAVAADHVVADHLAISRDHARRRICVAARTLRFMEHSGLRPYVGRHKLHPGGEKVSELPDTDHATDWYDPASGQFVLIDEPYGDKPDDEARAEWARRENWHLRKSSWPGRYNPFACELYVATDAVNGFAIDALMGKIDAMPDPVLERDWTGDSAASHALFLSPGATSPQDRRRARARGIVVPRSTGTTAPYGATIGGQRRRPNAVMRLSDHVEIGRILKAAMRFGKLPFQAYQRLNLLRSALEDWLGEELEYRRSNDFDVVDVYYGHDELDALAVRVGSPEGLAQLLSEVHGKLKAAYPDCAPLRRELRKIDVAVDYIVRADPRVVKP